MDTRFMPRLGSSPPQSSLPSFEEFLREQYPVVVRIAFGVVGTLRRWVPGPCAGADCVIA